MLELKNVTVNLFSVSAVLDSWTPTTQLARQHSISFELRTDHLCYHRTTTTTTATSNGLIHPTHNADHKPCIAPGITGVP